MARFSTGLWVVLRDSRVGVISAIHVGHKPQHHEVQIGTSGPFVVRAQRHLRPATAEEVAAWTHSPVGDPPFGHIEG